MQLITIDEAREWLRIDGTDNDEIIQDLIDAVPPYIAIATGVCPTSQYTNALCKTVGKFLLILWYNAEQSEAERLQRTIKNLLISIKAGFGLC